MHEEAGGFLLGCLINYSFTLHKLKEPEGVSKGSEEGDKKYYYFFPAYDLKLPETERGGANTDRSVANRLL